MISRGSHTCLELRVMKTVDGGAESVTYTVVELTSIQLLPESLEDIRNAGNGRMREEIL